VKKRIPKKGVPPVAKPTAIPIASILKRRPATPPTNKGKERAGSPSPEDEFLTPAAGPSRVTSAARGPVDIPSSPPPDYGRRDSSSSLPLSSEDHLTLTTIAYEAAGKVAGPSGAATAVLRIVEPEDTQLPSSDEELPAVAVRPVVKSWLGSGGTNKEVSSLVVIMESRELIGMALMAKSFDGWLENVERSQRLFNYTGNYMLGNSKVARAVNKLIEAGRPQSTADTPLTEMRAVKSKWSGAVSSAPKEGLRFVSTSAPWLRWLEEYGVDPGQHAGGQAANIALANLISRNTADISAEEVGKLADWAIGSTDVRLPNDLSKAELQLMGSKEELPYRRQPSSMGSRQAPESESRWLVAACRLQRAAFSLDPIRKLSGEFMLDPRQMQALRDLYGLFGGQR